MNEWFQILSKSVKGKETSFVLNDYYLHGNEYYVRSFIMNKPTCNIINKEVIKRN